MSNHCMSWNFEDEYENSICIFVFIPTFVFHILFWFQVCQYKNLRHCSLIWIYNYLLLDMISLLQILLEYITRHSNICSLNFISYNLLCILEAYTNNYTTMVQSFALILTNVYRYRLIVKNKAISIHSVPSLIFIHLFIYLLPLSVFILQYFFSSAKIHDVFGLSCDAEFTLLINQLINSSILVILPTFINIPVILMVIQHVRSSQNAVGSVRRIHRQLIIQFIVLYTIWFSFFFPQVTFMLSLVSLEIERFVAKLLDIAAILSDVIVITLFDRRFLNAWKMSIHQILKFITPVDRRVHPQNIQLEQIR